MDADYELKRLEGIISNDIASFVEMKHDLFTVFRQAIKDETDRVKSNFSQATFRLEKKRQLKRYIRFHQQAIIRLEGYLLNYADPDRITYRSQELDKATLCQYLYFCLEELLSFVCSRFPEYFDQNMWIPESYRLIILHQIKRDFKALDTGLQRHGIDDTLRLFALQPLAEFMDNSSSNEITYQKVHYLRELQKALLELTHTQTDNAKENLQWLLFRHNFNSADYVEYCTQQIQEYTHAIDDSFEKLDRLSLVQKLIYQHLLKPGFAYDTKLPTLQGQLSDWISQEMSYLETKLQRLTNTDEQQKVDSTDTFKVKFDLSVAQLIYLVKVFVELKIIQGKNVISLLRFIPNFAQTKRSESLGFSSIKSRYYKPESSTKKAIRDLLLRMVKYIEKSELLT